MNKMIGIILMIIGGILFAIGLIKFVSKDQHQNNINTVQSVQSNDAILVEREINDTYSQFQTSEKELQSIIDVATADGVLTQNEKDTIRVISSDKNFDYDQIISKIEDDLKNKKITAETEIIDQDKKKGTDFEKYVVEKFNKKFFKIIEWAGDKYVNGRYAESTLQPDLTIDFKLRDQKRSFAVECKYRSEFYQGGVVIASEEQLKRYKKFENQENKTVYLALGVGGSASAPNTLYIMPLSSINSSFISSNQLKNYYKNPDKDFFYDLETEHLN